MAATSSKPFNRPTWNEHAFIWGLVFTITGVLLFVLAAFSYWSHSLLYSYDQLTSAWFAQLRSQAAPTHVDFLKLLGQLGSDGTAIFTVVLMGFYLLRKSYRQFLLLLTAVGGGEIVWLLLVFTIDRPRPQPVSGLGGMDLPSFPSGHAELVITVFLLLLYIFSPRLPSRVWGLAFAAFVLVWALLTGAIRLFLNVHYFTDVLAGYALGLAWTGITILIVDGYAFRKKTKN